MYLYALQMDIPGYPFQPIKIGLSANPYKRKQSYTNGPFPVRWLGIWEGTKEDEAAIHTRLAEFRMNGEWFLPAPSVRDALRPFLINSEGHRGINGLFAGGDYLTQERRLPGETDLETRERLFGGFRA